MSKSVKQKSNIEIDTIEIGLTAPYYKFPHDIERYKKELGFIYRLNVDNVYFKLSSKVCATPKDIGAFTLENYKDIPDIIASLSGIEVDGNQLLNVVLPYSIHVKKDIQVNELPTKYLSLLRELFKRSTDKYDVYRYNDLPYENGVQILPKKNIATDLTGLSIAPKTMDNYKFNIYRKGKELDKPDNKEFKQRFDFDYLLELNQVIRFEFQMRKFDDFRNAFHVNEPTLSNIFKSDANPVYDFFMKLLKVSEMEDDNEIRRIS